MYLFVIVLLLLSLCLIGLTNSVKNDMEKAIREFEAYRLEREKKKEETK